MYYSVLVHSIDIYLLIKYCNLVCAFCRSLSATATPATLQPDVSAILTEVSEVVPINAYFPINLTLAGILTEVRLEPVFRAYELIISQSSCILIEVAVSSARLISRRYGLSSLPI